MEQEELNRIPFLSILVVLIFTLNYILLSFYSYLLFHTFAELFSIIIAFSIFVISWNTRKFTNKGFFQFLGLAYLFIALIDTIHTLAYKGMNIFIGYGTNLSVQLWIIARYMECISILIAILYINKKIKFLKIISIYTLVTAIGLTSIFYWRIFPVCYVEGSGLTLFKIYSEYLIDLVLLIVGILIYLNRSKFDNKVLKFIYLSLIMTMFSELAFTFYIDVYGFSNLVGHIFKIASFYFLYIGLVETSLKQPYTIIFRDLNLAKKEAELANEQVKTALDQFAYIASHDLQTPLRLIVSYNTLLQKRYYDRLDDDGREFIKYSVEGARQIKNLLDNYLFFFGIDNKRLILNEIDLNELINNIKHDLAIFLSEPDSKITYDYLPTVIADEVLVTQLLRNLISNAIKFRSEEPPHIHISVESDKNYNIVSIQDNGIGIESQYYEKIFKMFQKLDKKQDSESTGIGLTLCKKIVQKHGGKIWVESEGKDRGSTFYFTLLKHVN